MEYPSTLVPTSDWEALQREVRELRKANWTLRRDKGRVRTEQERQHKIIIQDQERMRQDEERQRAQIVKLMERLELRELDFISFKDSCRQEEIEVNSLVASAEDKVARLQESMKKQEDAIRREYEHRLEQLQKEHNRELEEDRQQSIDEVMENVLSKVTRLQARIGEAARALGMAVSWMPPHGDQLSEDFDEMETWLSRICMAVQQRQCAFDSVNGLRKQLHNNMVDMRGRVRVLSRCRPLLDFERNNGWRSAVTMDCAEGVVNISFPRTGKGEHDGKPTHHQFDYAFGPGATQDDIFDEIKPLLQSFSDGYSVCVLAYGQTRSGKTYTLVGSQEEPGIIERAIQHLMTDDSAQLSIDPPVLHMAMLEVYNDDVIDLLAASDGTARSEETSSHGLNLENITQGACVQGAWTLSARCIADAMEILDDGFQRRRTAETKGNRVSSRSHCLVRITLSNKDTPDLAQLWFVDLAGSERQLLANADGRQQETVHINSSLAALEDCLVGVHNHTGGTSSEGSKLTHKLQEVLTAETKIVVLVTLNPTAHDAKESQSTLAFAKRLRCAALCRGPRSSGGERDVTMLKKYMQEALEENVTLQGGIRAIQAKVAAAQEASTVEMRAKEATIVELRGVVLQLEHLAEEHKSEASRLTQELQLANAALSVSRKSESPQSRPLPGLEAELLESPETDAGPITAPILSAPCVAANDGRVGLQTRDGRCTAAISTEASRAAEMGSVQVGFGGAEGDNEQCTASQDNPGDENTPVADKSRGEISSIDKLVASAYKPSAALLRSTQRRARTGATPAAPPSTHGCRHPLKPLQQPWAAARVLTYEQGPGSQPLGSPLLPISAGISPAQQQDLSLDQGGNNAAVNQSDSGAMPVHMMSLPKESSPASRVPPACAGSGGGEASTEAEGMASAPDLGAGAPHFALAGARRSHAPALQSGRDLSAARRRRHTLLPGSPATRMRQFLASTAETVGGRRATQLPQSSTLHSQISSHPHDCGDGASRGMMQHAAALQDKVQAQVDASKPVNGAIHSSHPARASTTSTDGHVAAVDGMAKPTDSIETTEQDWDKVVSSRDQARQQYRQLFATFQQQRRLQQHGNIPADEAATCDDSQTSSKPARRLSILPQRKPKRHTTAWV